MASLLFKHFENFVLPCTKWGSGGGGGHRLLAGTRGNLQAVRVGTISPWCYPQHQRPHNINLAIIPRYCHVGTYGDEDVTWLFPASDTIQRFVGAGKHSTLNTASSLTINSAQPLPMSAFEESMHHLSKKMQSLRTCFRQRENKLWVCELKYPQIDFKVISGDPMEEISSLLDEVYNERDGPLWKVRVLPCSNTDPCPIPEGRSAFPHQYHLIIATHHAANDGLSLLRLNMAAVELLGKVVKSIPINEFPLGSLSNSNMAQDHEQEVKEELVKDPELVEALITEMSSSNIKCLLAATYEATNNMSAPKTKMVYSNISPNIMQSFSAKCKSAGVTVNSGLNCVIDRALVELVREAGMVEDKYSITSRHAVSERRYLQRDPATDLGCYTSAISHTMKATYTQRKHFWQYATIFNTQFMAKLEQPEFYKQRILRTMFLQRDPNFSYDKYYATQPPLLCHYFMSNTIVPSLNDWDTGGLPLQVTSLCPYSQIKHCEYSNCHVFIKFQDRYSYCIMYSTAFMNEEVAWRFQQQVMKVLKDLAQS